MGRKPAGSNTIRFTASQRRLILDFVTNKHIRNDPEYDADWKIVVDKLSAQNKSHEVESDV